LTNLVKKLLTPSDVADLLQISEKTVYKHKNKFGGFYPAGLRILRFKQEVVHGIMEGQNSPALVLQVPVPGQELYGQGIQGQEGGRGSKGCEKKRSKNPDKNRHGIFGGM